MTTGRRVRTIVAQVEGTPVPPESPEEQQGGSKSGARNIPKGHEFDARALKPLSRALFSTSVALGNAVTAYKEFARIKSSSVSPDGMLGGRGYVMPVKEIRGQLQQACELLSAVTDTLFDEMNGPHWKPKLAELDENEAEDISELLGEAAHAVQDPESVGQEGIDEIESRNDGKAEGGSSKVPETGGPETSTAKPMNTRDMQARRANSSLPVSTLPGPRVDHLDRGEQTGPGGSYNVDDGGGDEISDLDKPREHAYISMFARSGLPDSNEDPTPTDANDLGIGYGAKGKGVENVGDKGPSSGLPGSPGPGRSDEGVTPYMDGIERNLWAASSSLPDTGPVSRSDYYDGDKGNQFNVSVHGQSEIPGDNPSIYNYDRDTPNSGAVLERQDVPYVKYDWTTHNYRNDPQDLYRYDDDKGTNG
jgi:hypothetical protein